MQRQIDHEYLSSQAEGVGPFEGEAGVPAESAGVLVLDLSISIYIYTARYTESASIPMYMSV